MTETAPYAPSARLHEVRAMLDRQAGATLYDIAEALGVSRLTAYRYVRALEASGEPLFEELRGRRKVWRLMPTAGRNTITINTGQLVALALERRIAGFLDGTGLGDGLDEVLDRLKRTLGARDAGLVRNLDRKIFDVNEAPRDYRGRADDVNELLTALLREERLECRHARVGQGKKTFLLDPYSMFIYRKGLYVAGYSHTHGEIRDFALDSLKKVEWRRGDKFRYPDDYHPSQLAEGRFGILGGPPARVRIFFTEKVEYYVRRRRRHPTQKIRRVPGGIELTMEVRGTVELKSWVLGYGEQAEVLEPETLRREMASELRKAAARYVRKRGRGRGGWEGRRGCYAKPSMRSALDLPATTLNAGLRAFDAFEASDIRYLGDLVRQTEFHLLRVRNPADSPFPQESV